MKKILTTVIANSIACLAFAQDANFDAISLNQPVANVVLNAQQATNNSLIYVKMSASESELPKNDDHLLPGLGIGYRKSFGHHGFDISTEQNIRQVTNLANEKVLNYTYKALQADYLFYATPSSNDSLYVGFGLGVGGVRHTYLTKAKDEVVSEDGIVTPAVEASEATQSFHGFIPNASVGYEFNHKGSVKSFVQLEVSQPALSVIREGSFPGPQVGLSGGIGF